MEYEDWTTKNCLKAILPENVEFSGFEQCGHIIHLNLREKLLPFRFVIGRILLDKIQRTRFFKGFLVLFQGFLEDKWVLKE